jgi:hypothetical protein
LTKCIPSILEISISKRRERWLLRNVGSDTNELLHNKNKIIGRTIKEKGFVPLKNLINI